VPQRRYSSADLTDENLDAVVLTFHRETGS
jgi:hypothetical protein